jgi:hypothetical protein
MVVRSNINTRHSTRETCVSEVVQKMRGMYPVFRIENLHSSIMKVENLWHAHKHNTFITREKERERERERERCEMTISVHDSCTRRRSKH